MCATAHCFTITAAGRVINECDGYTKTNNGSGSRRGNRRPRSGASRSRLQPAHREDPIILHLGAGPAHYQKTINFVLHGRNQGPVDVYITDLGYGYLVIWVSRQQMGKMPAGRIV